MCGLKMMGEPVVSVLSSRSSVIPGASAPGAEQMVEVKIRCFILFIYMSRMSLSDDERV